MSDNNDFFKSLGYAAFGFIIGEWIGEFFKTRIIAKRQKKRYTNEDRKNK